MTPHHPFDQQQLFFHPDNDDDIAMSSVWAAAPPHRVSGALRVLSNSSLISLRVVIICWGAQHPASYIAHTAGVLKGGVCACAFLCRVCAQVYENE